MRKTKTIRQKDEADISIQEEEEIMAVLKPAHYTGRAPEQVEEFLKEFVWPVLEQNKALLGERVELSV